MSKLYILIGLPGSGKSTYAKRRFCDKRIISRDEIRFSMIDTTNKDAYFSKEKEVFRKYVHEIKRTISFGADCVADATHLNPPSRNKLINALGKEWLEKMGVEIVAVNIRTEKEVCLERNEQRDGIQKVPRDAIRRMAAQIVWAGEEIEDELDFDYSYIIDVSC